MKPYRWLLFDADDTLFDYDRSEVTALENACRHFNLAYSPGTLETYKKYNRQLWRAFELGEVTSEELRVRRFELLFGELGLSQNAGEFSQVYLEELSGCAFLLDGAEEVVRVLHQKYRLAMITNGLKIVQRPRIARSAIHDCFEDLIISEEIGAAKPETLFFEMTFQRLGYPTKEECLVIGDSLTSDMLGGCNYGLDTCWFNPKHLTRPAELAITYEIQRLEELNILL
jgi:2-haloacid dehalogenase